MATIPVLYGMRGAARWVLAFSVVHGALALILGLALGPVALAGFAAGIILLGVANYLVFAGAAMRALSLVHATLIIYAVAIIAAAVL